jgi:hypothetical protein
VTSNRTDGSRTAVPDPNGHKLSFGVGYDEGERLLALVPMIRGLVRYEAIDVSDTSLHHDIVFLMWFETTEDLEWFRTGIKISG